MNAPKPRLAVVEPSENGSANTDTQTNDLSAEVESLKDVLRDAYTRVNKLGSAIKRQKKQSRLLKTTLNSLRQLQQVGA